MKTDSTSLTEPTSDYFQFHDPSVISHSLEEDGRTVHYTNTVVIGNGPSGLSLSAFLSGWRPFYDLHSPHPNPLIHQNLQSNAHTSLINQEFEWLTSGVEMPSFLGGGGGGSFRRPFSLLLDTLSRPESGEWGEGQGASMRWEKREEESVPHVLLGQGAPGSSWDSFSSHIFTVSLSDWMDLPGVSMSQWWKRNPDEEKETEGLPFSDGSRVLCSTVQKYFRQYARSAGIQKFQVPFTLVTSVTRLEGAEREGEYEWHVIGYHSVEGCLHFKAKNLCLASGVSIPKQISAPPADTSSVPILHSLGELEKIPDLRDLTPQPVLVIGSGLSAADTVIHCLVRGIPVIHCFRSNKKEIRRSLVGRLAGSAYPEYEALAQLMIGRARDPNYSVRRRSSVLRLDGGSGTAQILTYPSGQVEEAQFSYAVVCIGFKAGISDYFPGSRSLGRFPDQPLDSKENVVDVDPISYRSKKIEGLYAVGPLVGDNFVRFLVGGSFAVAKDIIGTRNQ